MPTPREKPAGPGVKGREGALGVGQTGEKADRLLQGTEEREAGHGDIGGTTRSLSVQLSPPPVAHCWPFLKEIP